MKEADRERFTRQIQFLVEMDKMKNIYRQTRVLHEDRAENDAEHAWHLAMLALVLSEYANEPVDLKKVLATVLIHDIVEIDAGDTYAYDEAGNATKAEREQKAADRLFGLLPEDQAQEMRRLWDEFEANETPEAKFANALCQFARPHPAADAQLLQARRIVENARDEAGAGREPEPDRPGGLRGAQ